MSMGRYGVGKRLTELDYEDERRKCYIDAADGVEDRRALVLALRVADRVLAQGLGVRVRDVHDDEEEVSRNAEVEQEMDVQPDGVRGHERLLAYDYTNKSVQGRSVVIVDIYRSTYPTDEMRKKSVSTIAPPTKAPRSLPVSSSAPWER